MVVCEVSWCSFHPWLTPSVLDVLLPRYLKAGRPTPSVDLAVAHRVRWPTEVWGSVMAIEMSGSEYCLSRVVSDRSGAAGRTAERGWPGYDSLMSLGQR